jgi:hypothetical protein
MDARLSRRRTPSRTRRDLFPALLLGGLLGLAPLGLALLPVAASAQGAGSDTLTLLWTAPGDDGAVGTAARYEIRMSTAPISDANWGSATAIAGPPAPTSSGTRQSVVVRGLSRGTTYYFAIKTVDDADNVSGLSNVVRWDWIYDTAPPAAPTGLAAELENGTEARVRWSTNAEPDLAGYTVYRSLTPSGPFQAISPAGLTSAEFLDTTIPAGSSGVWYQVSATDVSGNESARSATLAVSLVTQAATVFELQPAYPNPSRGSDPVVIPLNVPTAGAGGAEILVMDAGGHRIRALALTGLSGGPQNVVWDGRNDAGNPVAPGVYTAWLMGSSERRSIKLVRLP